MRKSLKPLKHRKSNIFALRRKALKENDTTLQNASDFWRKTEEKENNVPDESLSIFTEKKGSFDVEYEKGIDNANVSGIAESVVENGNETEVAEKQIDKFIYQNGKLNNKKKKYVDFETMIVMEKDDTVIEEDYKEDNDENKQHQMVNENGSELHSEKDKTEVESDGALSVSHNDEDNNVSSSFVSDIKDDEYEEEAAIHQYKDEPSSKENIDFNNVTLPSLQAGKSSLIDLSMSSVNNDVIFYKDNIHYVKDLSNVKQKNGVSFLINNSDIETGVMYLKNGAYTNKENAYRSFCLLLLKGYVTLDVNGTQVCLKRNGMCVVSKGDLWSIKSHADNVSKIFVCYSLK